MSARWQLSALPLLIACNALLDIDAHGLAGTGGTAGSDAEAGRAASAGRANAGGSSSARGGAGFAANATTSSGEGGAPPQGGDSSLGGSGGAGSVAGASSTGGTVTTNACDLKCPSAQVCVDGDCVDCQNGERRCNGDGVPLSCVNQAWTEQAACKGAMPLCSNGTCVGIRLTGGFVSVQAASRSSTIRLVQGSLELAKPSCSMALGKCVVGGLRP
jgi:hypothetical protein